MELEIKPPMGQKGEMGQIVNFTIEASPLINPDLENMPSPVVVRLYILSAPGAFTDANFFQLWEKDEATLGATQLAKFETTLPPSGVKKIDAKLPDKAALVGVTVGFRDYKAAKWRAIVPFTGERTSKLKVQILTKSVTVVPQE